MVLPYSTLTKFSIKSSRASRTPELSAWSAIFLPGCGNLQPPRGLERKDAKELPLVPAWLHGPCSGCHGLLTMDCTAMESPTSKRHLPSSCLPPIPQIPGATAASLRTLCPGPRLAMCVLVPFLPVAEGSEDKSQEEGSWTFRGS